VARKKKQGGKGREKKKLAQLEKGKID